MRSKPQLDAIDLSAAIKRLEMSEDYQKLIKHLENQAQIGRGPYDIAGSDPAAMAYADGKQEMIRVITKARNFNPNPQPNKQ